MLVYCVTGGTGFIAAHLINALLAAGHIVRATVRDPEDESRVGFLKSMDGAKQRLKLVPADLMAPGSFDSAVEGVDGVFHTAAPVFVPYDDKIEDNLIKPIIEGTENVLRSCAKAKSVKRVVLTSSCSTIRYRDDIREIPALNESHWSDLEYCKRYNMWYAYAKTIAEKEAWRFAKENNIDLVAVNPSYVVGPIISPKPTSTLYAILSLLRGDRQDYPNTTIGFVHIDDVALAHILAMENKKASGRLICSSSVAHWSEIVEMIRVKYPSFPLPNKCNDIKGDDNPHNMDTTKIKELGFTEFKSLSEMFDDCIKSFQERGFL